MKKIKTIKYSIQISTGSRGLCDSLVLVATTLLAYLLLSGCRKLIEVDLPIDRNTNKTIFENTPTAVAAMNGVYAPLGANPPFVGDAGISVRSAVMADELGTIIPESDQEYMNNYTGSGGWNLWRVAYKEPIYRINSVLENISSSISLPDRTKQILTGEAKFARAWLYFYLTNLYGDVPLVVTTNYEINASIPRSPQELIYEQIEKDLIDAQGLLIDQYLDRDLVSVTMERIRPSKSAATALLARVYLYRQKWQSAEIEATKVISNGEFELLADLENVFLKNSRESIWQLQPNVLDVDSKNTPDGRFLINPFGRNPIYFPSIQLMEAFEPGDQRRMKWISTDPSGAQIIYKYHEGWHTSEPKEYTTVLRLAEQYLIRAEARAQQNKLVGPNSAESDLNAIRHRAGLPNTTATSQSDLLDAVAKERQVELFVEWGDRWFNLKRTGRINEVMAIVAPQKGGNWQPFKALSPIPFFEFNYNPALRGHQNPGYQEQP